MKASLIDVLLSLGLKYSRDMQTIIPPDAFEKLDDTLVVNMIDDYKLGLSGVYIPFDAERKFELVNRVLELKHGMILRELTEIDDVHEGYELEEITL